MQEDVMGGAMKYFFQFMSIYLQKDEKSSKTLLSKWMLEWNLKAKIFTK